MPRAALSLGFIFLLGLPLAAQDSADPVAQALAQGDLYQSRRKYELALGAYQKADKLSHHTSAAAYLKIASVEKKTGDFSLALDETKKAIKVAGDNKAVAVQALLARAGLLAQMAGKPTDKKLREAEEELRQALALDPGNPVTHLDLGIILLRQERDAEGIPELNTYISSPGLNPATVDETRRVIANPIRARTPFAPKFSFTTHEKQNISNASLRGKVVLLDFWGTWCPPCRASVPILRGLNKKYSGKPFQLVGISSDDDEDVWKTFIQEQHMNWQEYIDLSDQVLQAFKIESFPTYIVLDKDGVIRFRQSGLGEFTEGELSDAINKALKRESDPKLAAAAAEEASAAPAVSAPLATTAVPVSAPATRSSGTSGDSLASKEGKTTVPSDSAAPAGIEGGVVSGNVYKNAALGMTFSFPQGWSVANAQTLQALNGRTEAAARAAFQHQHPEAANSPIISFPKTIFYASRKGQWDGQHMEIPSLRMSAVPSRLDSVNLDNFQQLVEKMSAASGMKLTGPASEFHVNKHPFVRADFERGVGAVRMYQSLVQTIAGDYLLNIEIYAYSTEELQQAAASLQSMSITDDEP